jgi:hypothetical protein
MMVINPKYTRFLLLQCAQSGNVDALEACVAGLNENANEEYAACLKLHCCIHGLLDFPVQQCRLFALSWPFWPQLNVLGTAAALELGTQPAWQDRTVCWLLENRQQAA